MMLQTIHSFNNETAQKEALTGKTLAELTAW